MAKPSSDLDVVTDSRGRITLFDGCQPVCSVSSNGVPRPVKRPPSWPRVKKIDLVEGRTLNRVHILSRNSKTIKAVVKRIPASQRAKQCDTCPKVHSVHNPSCSANLRLNTFASKNGHLYNIHTKADLGKWRSDSEFLGSATVGTITYFR